MSRHENRAGKFRTFHDFVSHGHGGGPPANEMVDHPYLRRLRDLAGDAPGTIELVNQWAAP
jgi:hypothetical protein